LVVRWDISHFRAVVKAEIVTDTFKDYIFPPPNERQGTLSEMAKIKLPKEILQTGPEEEPVRVASALLVNVQPYFPGNE